MLKRWLTFQTSTKDYNKTNSINESNSNESYHNGFSDRQARRLWYINSRFKGFYLSLLMLMLRICCDATEVTLFQGFLRVWCTQKVAT